MKTRPWIAAAAGSVSALAAYALLVEPRWLQLRHRPIHIRALPATLEELRVGLLSDLHLGRGRSTATVRRAVGLLLRQRPDLVALTGDFAEDQLGLEAVLDALAPLRPPLGLYAVPGNHDHVAGIGRWHRALQAREGITDLTNRYVLLDHRGARICVAGVDDLSEGQPRVALPPPGARDLTILLAHSPDQAEHCRRSYDAVDLILSGHTHGGQVRLPGLPAPVNPARNPDLYQDGLRRRPWTQVYTSRGIGTSGFPVRFGARPEVALLELTRRPRPTR